MAPATRAQVTTAAPIPVQPPRTAHPRMATFDGQVVRADADHIIVRRRDDPRFIRTFSYSPEVRKKMATILERGGYQYGDRVKIRYQTGKDVALAIRGKPSNSAAPASRPKQRELRSSGSGRL